MNKRELIIEKYRNLVICNKTTKISIKTICDDVHKEFYIIAINDEGQNSLFNTILYEMEQFNRNLFDKKHSRNKFSKQDIEYYSYKNACLNVMLLKKWMQEGMIVSPEKMAEYYLYHLW